jgi:hypothetical protein
MSVLQKWIIRRAAAPTADESMLEQKAETIRAREPKLTREAAFTKACHESPSLVRIK